MGTMHRAQILLEPEQHQALAEIAHQHGRSISDLVREIINQHLADNETGLRREQAIQAIEEMAATRKQIQEEHGVYQEDLLNEIRDERQIEIEGTWREER
jgi:predicted DNA-binding protein